MTNQKLEALAYDKSSAHIVRFVIDTIENIVEKGENAGLPAFCPLAILFSGSLRVRIVGKALNIMKNIGKQLIIVYR